MCGVIMFGMLFNICLGRMLGVATLCVCGCPPVVGVMIDIVLCVVLVLGIVFAVALGVDTVCGCIGALVLDRVLDVAPGVVLDRGFVCGRVSSLSAWYVWFRYWYCVQPCYWSGSWPCSWAFSQFRFCSPSCV